MLYKVGDKVRFCEYPNYEFEIVHADRNGSYQYVIFSEEYAYTNLGHNGIRDGYSGNGNKHGHRFVDDNHLSLISADDSTIKVGDFVVRNNTPSKLVFKVVFISGVQVLLFRGGYKKGITGDCFPDYDPLSTETSYWVTDMTSVTPVKKGDTIKCLVSCKGITDFQVCEFRNNIICTYSPTLDKKKEGHNGSIWEGNGKNYGHWNVFYYDVELITSNNIKDDVQRDHSDKFPGGESGVCRRKVKPASAGRLVGCEATTRRRRIQGAKVEIRFSI